jgi:hypothetical protein
MPDLPTKDSADYASHGVRIRVIGVLAVIGVLVLLSQITTLWLLAGQQQATHAIAVASQQRTLSQQVVKSAYRLIGVGSTEARRNAYDEMRDSLAQLQRAHAGLQHGSDELFLAGNNSTKVALLFSSLDPAYQGFNDAAAKVLAVAEIPGELHQAVQRLSLHEADFLSSMSGIVAGYESDIAKRIGYARWLGLALGLATLAVLALAVRKVFQPVMAGIHRNLQQHADHEAEMEKMFSDSPAALFILNAASLSIERGNLKAEVLMGASADDFVGHPFSTHFDARLDANKVFVQKLRAGEAFDDLPVMLVDTRRKAVDALASVRPVAYSGLRCYLVTITDITGVGRR